MLLKEGELKEEVKHLLEIYFTVQSKWVEFRNEGKSLIWQEEFK